MRQSLFLLESALAAWRLAHMLVSEDGPNRMFARLREATGIEYNAKGKVVSYPDYNPLHCLYCTSMYTAAIVVWAPRWFRRSLAIAGAVIVIDTWVAERAARE